MTYIDVGQMARTWQQQWRERSETFYTEIAEESAPAADVPSPEPTLEEWRALAQTSSPRPTGWDGYIGNKAAVEILKESITAAQVQSRPMAHTLLYGNPGMGKSTLSRIVAEAMGGPFIETTASTLEQPMDLARLITEMNAARVRTGLPVVLFIDEIHMLGQSKGRMSIDQESVFSLLEDWIWYHNLKGRTFEAEGQTWTFTDTMLRVWPFTAIGATTEPGMLSEPLRRRFLQHVELQPYTEGDIGTIIQGAAARLGWPIDPAGAVELAKYARRNPGRSYQLLTAARNRAVATARPGITLEVATETIERLKLYPLGLTETDVRVMKLLADRMPRGIGMTEVCRAAGIAESTFRGVVEPYLRLLGFIETLARRVITSKGLVYLAGLNLIDTSRVEVRAAMEQS